MIRYVLKYAGKNVFVDNRSFKNKSYAKRKLEELEEVYHTCIDLKAVEVESVEESQAAQIKILREALGLVLANTDTAITTRVLLNRVLAEIDKMKGV